jgi:hypothetical protein
MNSKTKFKKMYDMLTGEAKVRLIYNPYSKNPITMYVLYYEIMNNTKLGKKILKEIIKNENKI